MRKFIKHPQCISASSAMRMRKVSAASDPQDQQVILDRASELIDDAVCEVNDEDFMQELWGDEFRDAVTDRVLDYLEAEYPRVSNNADVRDSIFEMTEGYGEY